MDGSVGVVWEKNPGSTPMPWGVAMSEKLTQTLTANTTLTQGFAGLWKMDDFGDALFTLGVSLAARCPREPSSSSKSSTPTRTSHRFHRTGKRRRRADVDRLQEVGFGLRATGFRLWASGWISTFDQ